MIELEDTDSFNGSINNTNSKTVEVNSSTADYIELLVDDTSGNAPPSYDVTVEFYSTAVDSYMVADNQTGLTDNNPDIPTSARGQRVRVTITNSSGSSDNYRVSLESFKKV